MKRTTGKLEQRPGGDATATPSEARSGAQPAASAPAADAEKRTRTRRRTGRRKLDPLSRPWTGQHD